MILFIIEEFTRGRWRTNGWRQAQSLEDALIRENDFRFIRVRGFKVAHRPWRVREATAVEVAYARERNEFLAEQHGP